LIPASVQIIGQRCFADRKSLRRITFETGSALRTLDAETVFQCGSCSVEMQHRVDTFRQYRNPFRADGAPPPGRDERIQATGAASIHPAGQQEPICIPASVETTGQLCFGYTMSFSSIAFEINSKLQTIDFRAFFGSAIQSIFME
jgi:hypothetical protein